MRTDHIPYACDRYGVGMVGNAWAQAANWTLNTARPLTDNSHTSRLEQCAQCAHIDVCFQAPVCMNGGGCARSRAIYPSLVRVPAPANDYHNAACSNRMADVSSDREALWASEGALYRMVNACNVW